MTLLVLGLSLCIPFVRSSPSSFNGTSTPMLDASSCPSSSTTRTLSDIIWSCAATLFACTWTAIHPNIPGVDEGKIAIIARRLFIMVMALIAPELIITWAARQFFSARQAAKDFNNIFGAQLAQAHGDHQNTGDESTATLLAENLQSDSNSINSSTSLSATKAANRKLREWTVTHGFFAWMGGFLLCIGDNPRATLTPDELYNFILDGSADIPDIDERSLEDRSKGDILSKGIAIIQLGWFVIQLVARYFQNLPISLLEIDTLAIAALTCIAYGWWWKKPKDLGLPYIVHLKGAPSQYRLAYDQADALLVAQNYSSYFYYLINPFTSLMGLPRISPRAVRSRRIPSLGGYASVARAYDHSILLIIGISSGIVFGAIHCAAWNFSFQGPIERILWHASSIAILSVSAPICICLGYENLQRHSGYLPYMDDFLDVVIIVSYFIYVGARLTLIVLMLWSLRSLPPGVYDTIAWTKFIPHI